MRWLLVALTCTLLVASTARGEEPAREPPVEPHWYGGSVLLADGLSLGLFAGGAAVTPSLAIAGAAGWVLAAPIIHASHAGFGHAAGSLGLRLGLPLLGMLLGAAAVDGCWREPNASDACEAGMEVGGFMLGAVVAEILDVAWLARDEHPIASPPAPSHPTVQFALTPRSGGAVLGLGGSF
jgi:hypothetical protein